MIRIECEPPVHATCECCGTDTTRLTRFVFEDEAAYAVYFAAFGRSHPEVKAVVSVGTWGDGSSPAGRVAFPLVLWQNADNHAVTLVDRADSPWKDVELIGPVLDRDIALNHPRKDDVYHLTDHIFRDDPEIRAFFANTSES